MAINREQDLTKLLKECQDDVVEGVVSEVMLEVLESDIVPRPMAMKIFGRLGELANDFIDTGRFEKTLLIYNTLYSHSLSGRFHHQAADTVAYFFKSAEFIRKFVTAVHTWGIQHRDGVSKLARAFRVEAAGPLLDAALQEPREDVRKFMIAVLSGMGADIVPEVNERFSRTEPDALRMLLFLIRKCGSEKDLAGARKLIGHRDSQVSSAALRTLLHFKTRDSYDILNQYLESRDDRVRHEAIGLAGDYRVKEAFSALVSILDRKDRFGTAWAEKTLAVRALGRIGNRECVPFLKDILQSKSLLNRARLDELKLEVFRSLKGYPPAAVEPLLKLGVWSDQPEIKAISAEIMTAFYAAQREKKGA